MKIVSLLPNWERRLSPLLGSDYEIVDVAPGDADRLRAELRDADVILADKLTAGVAALCPGLKAVVCPFAGTERIDRAGLPARVPVINGGGTEEPIAEYIIGMLVATRRKLFSADRALRSGRWLNTFWGEGSDPGNFVEEVYGSTLGLIGYGRIAKETIRRADAFGIACRAVTLHPERAVPLAGIACAVGALADPAAVDALLAWSDAVAICCEISDLTRGLIDARRLALMKTSAVLINVARGPIVVERDLYEALRARRIAGAVVDVWYRYPETVGATALPSEYPFGELDNVVMTPHYSGWTKPAMKRRIAMLAIALEKLASASAR